MPVCAGANRCEVTSRQIFRNEGSGPAGTTPGGAGAFGASGCVGESATRVRASPVPSGAAAAGFARGQGES
ncbi:hypothetical protein GCM10010442_69210 [Kitasatospora kifunensis]